MTVDQKIPGESVESILISSNFFLWLFVAMMDSDQGWLVLSLFLATLISFFIIMLVKIDSTIILQKLGLFFGTNVLGLIILLTSLDFDFQEETDEFDNFMLFVYLQIILFAMLGIILIVRRIRANKSRSE